MRKLIFALLATFAPLAHATTLNWVAPTQNTNGTPLTDLAGYQIFQWLAGQSPVLLASVGLVTTYTPVGLPPGTNCFFLRAVNAAGKTSPISNTTCTTVAAPPAPTPNAPTGVQAAPTP